MARRHADDMVFYAMLGIIVGGRIGYVLFYNLGNYLRHPIEIFKLWDGGTSLHGGVVGVLLAIWYVTRKEKLNFLRFCDYIACVVRSEEHTSELQTLMRISYAVFCMKHIKSHIQR